MYILYPISSQVFCDRFYNEPVYLFTFERILALFNVYAWFATILTKCTYQYKGNVMMAPNHWLLFLKVYILYLPEVLN